MTGLLTLALVVLAFAAGIFFIIKRAADFTLLAKDGEDTQGRVVQKSTHKPRKSSRRYYIKYEYQGLDGKTYSHQSLVTNSVFDSVEENGKIDIAVSRSKPSVSAPKYLVDEAKRAVNNKIA